VIEFLEGRCGLNGPLPGIVVEHHGELFERWRSMVEEARLVTPFHLTHVDAHADLGQGELCQEYLLSELLHEEPGRRTRPRRGEGGLTDGSFLAFAVACRWIKEIDYVFGSGGGEDIPGNFKPRFAWDADAVQLAVLHKSEVAKLVDFLGPRQRPVPARLEPAVPVKEIRWPDYQADGPFDLVCLARSPAFTPPESDAIFDEIRRRYVDEATSITPR
jgi:hypothetical protein